MCTSIVVNKNKTIVGWNLDLLDMEYRVRPESLQTLNTYVWQKWFPTEGKEYKANGKATLEVYSAGNPRSSDYECGIWVPVKEA